MNAVLEEILQAVTPAELFGSDLSQVKAGLVYRKFARKSHPDMFTIPSEKLRAEEAFIHLTQLWDTFNTPWQPVKSNILKTRYHEYTLGLKFSSGNLFDRYEATYDDGHGKAELLVTKSDADEDLSQNNFATLKVLAKELPEDRARYYPKIIESFRWKQSTGNLVVTAVERIDGFFTLAQVKERYPNGVDPKDFAWIFRRMLYSLSNLIDMNIVHGAVTPESVLIHPEMHGLLLRDWQYSVSLGVPLEAIPAEYQSFYPKSVFSHEVVTSSLDILLAAKTAETILSENSPKQFKAFLNGCKVLNPPNAGELLNEFDELLTRIYGQRSFHVFTMNP